MAYYFQVRLKQLIKIIKIVLVNLFNRFGHRVSYQQQKGLPKNICINVNPADSLQTAIRYLTRSTYAVYIFRFTQKTLNSWRLYSLGRQLRCGRKGRNSLCLSGKISSPWSKLSANGITNLVKNLYTPGLLR